jgi:hypothetical protein
MANDDAAATWLSAARRYFDQFWNRALAAFKVAAERDKENQQ